MYTNGYIKLHRKILNNPVVLKDSDHFAVWIYLLLNATHTPIKVENCGEIHELKAGQLITGCSSISRELKVNENKIKRVLNRFENARMIDQITYPRKGRIITVLNWNEYQGGERINDRLVNEYRTNNDRIMNCNKNIKNINIREAGCVSNSAAVNAAELGMTVDEYASRIEELRR